MDSKTKLTLSNAINLLHGDCLELMKSIPDKSIDMVLCDPPYGTTACKWDVIIAFEPMWNELKRITKDNGATCLFGSEPFSSHLRLSNLKMFKYDWIWEKDNASNFFQAKFCPLNKLEIISVFSMGGTNNGSNIRMKYYPQGVRSVNWSIENTCDKGGMVGIARRSNCSMRKGNKYIQTITGYPDRLLKYKRDKAIHPTQKPVALLEYLIKTYTLENETVLDFTMGSGSTGVACVNLNRKFIGIEKDDKYFEIAKGRIDSTLLELFQ